MAADGFEFSGSVTHGALAAPPRTLDVAFSGHFGVLHLPPPSAARGVTVVLCPSIGRDARCTYRALFDFAELLSTDGFAVLRYDHLGEGDSSPLEPEADRWPEWMAGVEAAAAFARSHGGGTRLVLAGLRLGAGLAAAASHAVAPDALMLLAPVASGRAWLRELQATAALVGAPSTDDGAFELDGLRLNRATIASLNTYDLRRLAPPAAPVFLAQSAPDPRLDAALGASVTCAPFPGYATLFREAHLNESPTELFTQAAAWLRDLPSGVPFPAALPPPAVLRTSGWVEEAVTFGDGLRGVLTLPATGPGRRAVIIGNTGADPRYGIGSFAAQAARSVAARGLATLRFDFSGLGQSRARASGQWRPHIYLTDRTDEFRAAADVLRQRGYDELTLAGVCAGGHHALRAAIADPRFDRVLAINTFLVWRPLLSLESRPAGGRRVRLSALLKLAAWRRLLHGEVKLGEALGLVVARLRRQYGARRVDAACRELRRGVRALAGRGARVRLIVGRDDDSLEGLESDFGPRGAWLSRHRRIQVSIQADLDHGLFAQRCRTRMIEELTAFASADPRSAIAHQPTAPVGAVIRRLVGTRFLTSP